MDVQLIREFVKYELSDFGTRVEAEQMDAYYDRQEDMGKIEAAVRATISLIVDSYYILVCATKGHNFVEADGSAESGSFYHRCGRCGYVIDGYWGG